MNGDDYVRHLEQTAQRLLSEIARLQAVVDVVRKECQEIIGSYGVTHASDGYYDAAAEILLALDGEVKP